MPIATSIVIVRPEHVVSIRKRLAESELVAVISEAELLLMQDTILARVPELLVMHAAFAATSRGAFLVSAIKAKPREHGTSIRVFIEDDVKVPLLLSEASSQRGRPCSRPRGRSIAPARARRRATRWTGAPSRSMATRGS